METGERVLRQLMRNLQKELNQEGDQVTIHVQRLILTGSFQIHIVRSGHDYRIIRFDSDLKFHIPNDDIELSDPKCQDKLKRWITNKEA